VQQELQNRQNASESTLEAQQSLAQMACASALLRSTIKLDGRLLLQRKHGPHSCLAECNHRGELRGLLRHSAHAPGLSAPGILAITLEPERGERYQGIVPLAADASEATDQVPNHSSAHQADIIAALEQYFARSEQIPTVLLLASSNAASVGLIAQRVPEIGGHAQELDHDGWNRVQHLLATVEHHELLSCSAETLMQRMFHQERWQHIGSQALRFHCPCSAERVQQVLISLGAREALACVQDDGYARAQCEFCNADYQFDAPTIGAWFTPANASRH
jgi:molecular chaperone Hsp33